MPGQTLKHETAVDEVLRFGGVPSKGPMAMRHQFYLQGHLFAVSWDFEFQGVADVVITESNIQFGAEEVAVAGGPIVGDGPPNERRVSPGLRIPQAELPYSTWVIRTPVSFSSSGICVEAIFETLNANAQPGISASVRPGASRKCRISGGGTISPMFSASLRVWRYRPLHHP